MNQPSAFQLEIVTVGDAPATAANSGERLLEQLLRSQHELSAVEQFSVAHNHLSEPSQSRYYRALPAAEPGPGQQYAFDVDLDCCSGCKACVAACHTLNGLDEQETWRDVGLLLGGTRTAPVMQHVTTACHHCLNPACMEACPVDAYEKDPATGIVRHLDDQCFGCQYCTLACPYDVPKYHAGLGIVRKCDMCSQRLKAGEAPACVQACPHEAIRIQVVDVGQVAEDAEAAVFLPAAPDPQITLPTTTYRTQRVFPRNLLPADYYDVHPQHPHWPLIVMLVLTQLSVGSYLVSLLLKSALPPELWSAVEGAQATGALAFGMLALAASVLHLGRPQYAFRGILGLRHSWLSREILAFGVFAGLATGYFAAVHAGDAGFPIARQVAPALAIATAASGLVGVYCSVMIYAFTRRELWTFVRTAIRFGLTTALLGSVAVWISLLGLGLFAPSDATHAVFRWVGPDCARAVLLLSAVKLGWEASLFWHLRNLHMSSLRRSAMLMKRPLADVTIARFAAGALGGLLMPALLLWQDVAGSTEMTPQFFVMVCVLVAATVLGELLERYLFFAAVAVPRMPGAIQ